MTDAVMCWVNWMVHRETTMRGPVLEVGALDVNGSVRGLFVPPERFPSYIGLDVQAGPSVQVQAKADALPFREGQFGVVVCTETLEHDDRFWISLREFYRVLGAPGHVLITARGLHFPRHDYPSDLWRFTSDGLRTVMEWVGFSNVDTADDNHDKGVYGIGERIESPSPGPGGKPAAPSDRQWPVLEGSYGQAEAPDDVPGMPGGEAAEGALPGEAVDDGVPPAG